MHLHKANRRAIQHLFTTTKLTQAAFGKLFGVNRFTVMHWLDGTQHPSPKHLKHIQRLYNKHTHKPLAKQLEK